MTTSSMGMPTRSATLRWGLPDALLVFVGGLVVSLVGQVLVIVMGGYELEEAADEPIVLAVTGIFQFAGMLGTLVWTSRRKGLGSLRADFGLRFSAADWWYLPLGAAVQIAAIVMLVPLAMLDDEAQGVVEQLEDASGLALGLLALIAVVVAPVVEELLFRGLLLRALLRRVGPAAAVAWSASLFGVVHLVDPSTVKLLPAFVALGVVSAIIAIRSGGVGRSILLHAGFNLFTAIAVVAS